MNERARKTCVRTPWESGGPILVLSALRNGHDQFVSELAREAAVSRQWASGELLNGSRTLLLVLP